MRGVDRVGAGRIGRSWAATVADKQTVHANDRPGLVSRRALLRAGSLLGGTALVACTSSSQVTVPAEQNVDAPLRHPVPPAHTPTGVLAFFTEVEARTVEAVTARIIPGDARDPGAREAAVVTYIDAKLAEFKAFAEPTFLTPPFAEGYAGTPPPASVDAVPVPEDQLYRYGYQSGVTPQEAYRNGLPGLDRYARRRFGVPFVELTEADQDAVLDALDAVQQRSEGEQSEESGSTPAEEAGPARPEEAELDAVEADFGEVDPGEFFTMVRTDTIEGMFADPAYGGNRGLVGWNLVGYPGPQRAYSPEEMLVGARRQPQALDGLPAMNPDRRHQHGPEAVEQPRAGVRDG
ncbi:gluconate 2-dehydrogenase subunit 3 family protein [Micromonospora polyrhachis]|uniref:Gluconate 2-dehydrogenase gamma chain n=1 Tax=Micromonospora polyrhachis TaxID=1282883 RepID=A0A7W7WQ23_9ACTN|nr:gluconate 2-dehydrogenase subunit 3 family protein [Micromonospora polyrhachis]MBB4958833.1 gluconate 2-dehydrogenase gamma chain [Micromonospora polyrhachis]